MDLLNNLALGFQTAVTLENLGYSLIGCVLGTLIGVLPGLGPLATISMLLPVTYGLDPTSALIMLAGIYYGAAYGGSTTAILVNLPGETSSVVTVLDGYQMAKKGRAGIAISTAAIGSFFAGCVGTLLLAVFATPLTSFALQFGGAEYFSLMVVGLIGAVSLSSGSVLKSIGMILIGILMGIVGTDTNTGTDRFTFGLPELWDGLNFIVIAVGIFALGEIISTLGGEEESTSYTDKVGRLLPGREDFRRMWPAILRGTGLGSLLGLLPGAGISIASFMSYGLERKVSRYGHELGTGAIEGVAGPESANNAAAQTAFIPTLTLGIPGSATMALMLGAMIMHSIQPGPQVMVTNPDLFWGLIVSMWVGNVILVMLNLPLVGIWVKLLKVPYNALFPAILVFSCIGVFGSNFSTFDLLLTAGFGLFGYLLRQLNCEAAPLILGFILGPMMEDNFRRAMVLSKGDPSTFITSPISAAFLLISAVMLALILAPAFRRKRTEMVTED